MIHIPVLLEESLNLLSISNKQRILDATFGGGGHTRAILSRNPNCHVTGIDRDPDAKARADLISQAFPDRFSFVQTNFSKIADLFKQNIVKFDAILFDFGVSSFQIDDPQRGFSFMNNGKLDMRMSHSENSETAMDIVNKYSEEDLASIIYNYGDEPKSRRIAANILKHRKKSPIVTTSQLRTIIDEAFVGKKFSKIDNATKTFQALRIYVNDELREIAAALDSLPRILAKGANIVTIAFHSLEDKIVKNWQKNNKNIIKYINKNVIKPSVEEVRRNPRSRSAVLRGFIYE